MPSEDADEAGPDRAVGRTSTSGHRKLVALGIAAAVAVLAGAVVVVVRTTSSKVSSLHTVPASILADCSRAVETEIMDFLATVPDGATVRFPANGCYGQDRTIVLRDRKALQIDGQGSTFKRITPPNPYDPVVPNTGNANWRISRGSDITLTRMSIRGNYQVPSRGKVAAQGQYTDHGISVWGGVAVTIAKVDIADTDGEFVGVDPDIETARALYGGDYAKVAPSRNVVIDGLRGNHAGRQCVATTSVDGFVMKNSSLADCQQTGFDAEIDVEGELNRNIRLINNVFSGTYFSAISLPVLSLPGFEGTVGNIEIRGNTMTQAPDTCYPAILVGADARGGMEGLTIEGNTLLSIGDGIQINSLSPEAVRGSLTGNDIAKTVENTGCDNPKLDPPHSAPVRLNGSKVNLSRTTARGYCCGQDQDRP